MEIVIPRNSFDSELSAALSTATFTANDFITPCGSPVHSSLPTFFPRGSPLSMGRRRLDAFDIVCLIGKGGFGKVFLVRHKATAAVYAMKVMDKDALVQRKAVQDAHAERNILALVGQSDVPFVIRLHVAFQTSRRVYLVMDFASGGELMFHLRREAMLSEEAARFYAAELLIALESLHEMDIIHRDIKPENVLLDGNGHLVLTDFGLAKEIAGLEDQAHSWCGSEDYMAPETVAREVHAGKPADYWAYGVFIYDCLCGHPPFSPLYGKAKLTRKRLHERILRCKYKMPAYLTPQCHSLLRKLLTKDPAKRLTDPAEIRAHPWFKSINWEKLRRKELTPPIKPSQSSPTACFSPSITKLDYSAPHSPIHLPSVVEGASQPIPIGEESDKGGHSSQMSDTVWQGFSFVAPGMEVHFELAPALAERPAHNEVDFGFALSGSGGDGPIFLGPSQSSMATGMSSPTISRPVDVEDALVAEVEAFTLDACEAVEIVEGEQNLTS